MSFIVQSLNGLWKRLARLASATAGTADGPGPVVASDMPELSRANPRGETAQQVHSDILRHAMSHGHTEIVSWLLEHGARVSYITSAGLNNAELVRRLLAYGVDVHGEFDDNLTEPAELIASPRRRRATSAELIAKLPVADRPATFDCAISLGPVEPGALYRVCTFSEEHTVTASAELEKKHLEKCVLCFHPYREGLFRNAQPAERTDPQQDDPGINP